MIVAKKIKEIEATVNPIKAGGQTVGFIPTMGFLHEGHFSLIKQAKKENDFVIVSIFVNPTQFGPNEDLEKYPRDPEKDLAQCQRLGVDLVFMPEVEEMYSDNQTIIQVTNLSDRLCGQQRPDHFQGVCTIVAKLFHITQADKAYFGEKDAQQLIIIKKMVTDLNMKVNIIGCPIVREPDGLAKSSRNNYLSEVERKNATCLYEAICLGKKIIRPQLKTAFLVAEMSKVIMRNCENRIDYIQVVDVKSLQPVEVISGDVLVALAVKIGKTRLIDNFSYSV